MSVTSASVLLNRLQARARLRHLQVLVKVAELRNLRRSAEALGLSQPAVTQLLADLERLVELPLFERHARGVRLTDAGRHFMELVAVGVDQLDHAAVSEGFGGKIGFDCTHKWPGENGYNRDYPKLIKMAPDVVKRIDGIWSKLGL